MKRMKKRFMILALSSLLLLSACSPTDPLLGTNQTTEQNTLSVEEEQKKTIEDLEKKILEIQQNQSLSSAEQQKEIQKLQETINELKNQLPTQSTATSDSTSSDTSSSHSDSTDSEARFLYSQSNGSAIITGYTGSDAHLVIPSEIDGYPVIAIGDSAFSSQTLKSVIVSNGIEKLDWFAFRDCPALISITLPDSVTSIGYSAFAPQSKSFTIYCHNDSFAHKYAKSYGWSYAII